MSRRVIGMAFSNQAKGDKSNNNAIGGIGARGKRLRNAIISRSTDCCVRTSCSSGGGSGNENFITLNQALVQGGVYYGQILFLDNNRGLVLRDDFTVQNGGFVILVDIVNPQGNLPNNSNGTDDNKFAGVFVPQGKKLTVLGDIVLGNISSDAVNNKDVYGVYNKGTIEISETGSISMGDISSVGRNAHGIFQESTIQKHTASDSAGVIQIGNITSDSANAFGVKNGDLNDVRVQIGNVLGSGEVAAVNLIDGTTIGNMSAHVIAGNVTNISTSFTNGVAVNDLSGSFSCGNVSSTGNEFVVGINVLRLSGSATCGNVEGNGDVTGIAVFATLSGSATCGNVSSTGTGDVTGIAVINTLSGSATCGDISSTGQSTTDNAIEVTGLLFTTVYPEAQVTIGNISATNGICRGATADATIPLAILAGTTTIGDITYDVNGIDTGATITQVYGGGFVFKNSVATIDINQNLSDSFVSYDGVGKGLEFEVRIDNSGSYELVTNPTNLSNTTGYVANEVIVINGEFFGGSQTTNNVELRITAVDNNGQIQTIVLTNDSGIPPTTPRVTTTGVITTNGLSGSFSVGNIKHTGTATRLNFAYIAIVSDISGKITGKNISADTSTRGLFLYNNTLSGIVSFGDVRCTGTDSYSVRGVYAPVLSGNATFGNVSSTGNDYVVGVEVANLSGSATYGDVSTTGSGEVYGVFIYNVLSGNTTCGNVSSTGDGWVEGIHSNYLISGSATCGDISGGSSDYVLGVFAITVNGNTTCGNISSTGSGAVYGVYATGNLSGNATYGNVISTGNGTNSVYGMVVLDDLSGSATFGDISSTNNGNVYGVYANNNLSGSVTYEDISSTGTGRVYGVFVANNLSGSVTYEDVSSTGNGNGNVYGVDVGTLSGSVTYEDVSSTGNGAVYGVDVSNDLSGSATCGNVSSTGNGNVYGIEVFNDLSGSATCGDVEGAGSGEVRGISVDTLSGSATCGDVSSSGDSGVYGVYIWSDLSGNTTCGNVSSSGDGGVYGVYIWSDLSGNTTCGNVSSTGNGNVYGIEVFNDLSGSATCGDVEGAGSGEVRGISVDTLSGSATCGDISSTGTSIPDNPIEVTGLFFTTVYPEAQVTIGNISATNGICRGATSTSPLVILAGTTTIGDITYDVNGINTDAGIDTDATFYSGGFVIKDFSTYVANNQNLSDSFVSYDGVGKGLEFEVRIDNSGSYELVTNPTNLSNTTGYVANEVIVINGEFFGGSQTNNVELRITAVDNNGQIQSLAINSANSGTPPTTPRVTTTNMITTNGLSGSFSVGNIKHTGTATTVNSAYIVKVSDINGKITGKNISADTSMRGLYLINTLSGIVSFGDMRCTGTGTSNYSVRGVHALNDLSGSATFGNVSSTGNGAVYGLYVDGIVSGSATYGDVSSTGSGLVYGFYIDNELSESGIITCGNITNISNNQRTEGGFARTLNGKVICGNVSNTNNDTIGQVKGIVSSNFGETGKVTCGDVSSTGNGDVYGVHALNDLSGSATCGNVEGDGDVYGIVVVNLSGSATCGDVEGTGGGAVDGIRVGTLSGSGSATCGNVEGTGRIRGIDVITLSGSATCGNLEGHGVIGIFVDTLNGSATCGTVEGTGAVFGIDVITLSGSATCGTVEGTGINSGTINGNVIIESASTGVNSLDDGGSGKVIIGAPTGGTAGTATNKLSAYIYGNNIQIP